MSDFWTMKKDDDPKKPACLNLFGSIGGTWLDDFDEKGVAYALDGLEDDRELDVSVNSVGGSVFAAMAIKGLLEARSHKAPVRIKVDGLAASAATIITCADGVPVTMAPGSMMLVHPVRLASSSALTAAEMRQAADQLDKVREGVRDIYAARTRQPVDVLDALMGKESWLKADEAVAMGFADAVGSGDAVDVSADAVMSLEGEEVKAESAGAIARAVALFARPAPEPSEPAAQEPVAQESAPEPVAALDMKAAVEAAVRAERERMAALDALADGILVCGELLAEAKSSGMSPAEFALRALPLVKNLSASAFAARVSDASGLQGLAAEEGNAGVFGEKAAAEAAEKTRLGRIAALHSDAHRGEGRKEK